jgi:hypothetical protein
MKKFSCFLVAVFLCAALNAAELAITVLDADLGNPIEGARVGVAGTGLAAETGADGIARIAVPDSFGGGTVTARSMGYRASSVRLSAGQRSAEIGLSVADVFQGNELVVERSATDRTDAKSGVSHVMSDKEMETTAEIGLVEDVMSSVKTLPGVGFAGGWDAQPSIRGGYPDEMGCVLDGIYVMFPYHWGGAYSIFNPSMVGSVKMSHGIFSARYGRAMSGLLEVSTIRPAETVRFNASVGTTSFDAFAQIPFGKRAGMFLGGKVTYLETLSWMSDALGTEPRLSETMPTMPYIRDFYLKTYFNPGPALELSFNGFLGTDGVGAHDEETEDGTTNVFDFDYSYYQGFAGINARWMPDEKVILHGIAAYNFNTMDMKFAFARSGYHEYGQAFLDEFDGTAFDPDGVADGLIQGQKGYTLTDFDNDGASSVTVHQGQGKLETDIQVTKADVVSFGSEEVFQFTTYDENFNMWYEFYGNGYPELKREKFSSDVEGNRVLNTSAFALWSHGLEDDPIQGELGLRAEHFYLWNGNFDLNTYPVLNPRLSVQWTPIRNTDRFDALTFSAGTGFFSMFPINAIAASEDFNIDDFDVGPNRAWYQVIGAEAKFPNDWTFKIEGYYKRYFNRLYMVEDNRAEDSLYYAKTDGTGDALGFDFLIQKKNGRKLDGYLSYSFVWANYRNPMSPMYAGQTTMSGEPLDASYYPAFHRFHSLNLILNWKPRPGMILTVKSSLATGKPKAKEGKVVAYAATIDNPDGTKTVVERYARRDSYDDSLRTSVSCPVDARFALSGYYRHSKLKWEYYVGAEDIFVNLYRPKTNKQLDSFTGEEVSDSDSADFNIGMPMVSFGYKVSY